MKKDGTKGGTEDKPERRPSTSQRREQSPEQGYDEERESGEIGYSEPAKRRANRSREERLKRSQSAAREQARRFWSFFDRLPGLWDELPENERAEIKARFAYIEPEPARPLSASFSGPATPSRLVISTSGKRKRRSRAQVISDLADEYERRQDRTMAESWIPKKGRRRTRYVEELTVEMEKRAAAKRSKLAEIIDNARKLAKECEKRRK
jgi:hypothetical protein